MGLCLLVYTLGQRLLGHNLQRTNSTLKNQLGKPTHRPTLGWIFQIFQAVHLVSIQGTQQNFNLNDERIAILNYCQHPVGLIIYYCESKHLFNE